jgi:hypothetical protein
MPRVKIVKYQWLTAYYKPKHKVYRVYLTDQTEDREICTLSMDTAHVSFTTHEPLTITELALIGELYNYIRNLQNL